MKRDAKNLGAVDCGHPECQSKNEQKQLLVGNLLKGEGSKEQQIQAGELLHDAFVLVNALPQELIDAIISSHGRQVRAIRMSPGVGQALEAMGEGQVWPSKGSERPN